MTRWSGSGLSVTEQRRQKRALILRHAAPLFNRRGSQAATLGAVAAELRISKAALYRYVSSKNDLLLACHLEALSIATAAADAAELQPLDGCSRLQYALRYHLENMISKLGVPALLLEEDSIDPISMKKVVGMRDAYERRLRKFYADGVADGSIVPGNAKLAVFSLLGALNWTAKWYNSNGPWSAADIAEAIAETTTRGIATKRRPFRSKLHISATGPR